VEPDQRTKRLARQRVAYAVRRGRLPRAASLPCADCDGPASQYDHWSYAPEHRLDVQPVCARCHKQRELVRGTHVLPDTAHMLRMHDAFLAKHPKHTLCLVCGAIAPKIISGRCNACSLYWKRTGVERPERLWRR